MTSQFFVFPIQGLCNLSRTCFRAVPNTSQGRLRTHDPDDHDDHDDPDDPDSHDIKISSDES